MKKRQIMASLTLLTAVTLTACNFQFRAAEDVSVTKLHIGEEITNIIDNADFTEDELTSLAEEVTSWAETYAEESESLEEFEKATLVRVVDGDTIIVNIEDGEYSVRLIGINTPESVASKEYLEKTGKENTLAGKEASQRTKNILTDRDYVYLQKDTSETDRYGRLLRYVWLEIPEDEYDLEEIKTKMLNGILVYEGVAEVATYEPDVMHQKDFETLEEEYEY